MSETTTLYMASQTNSTIFVRCCRVAVGEWDEHCPQCKKKIVESKGSRLRTLLAVHNE